MTSSWRSWDSLRPEERIEIMRAEFGLCNARINMAYSLVLLSIGGLMLSVWPEAWLVRGVDALILLFFLFVAWKSAGAKKAYDAEVLKIRLEEVLAE